MKAEHKVMKDSRSLRRNTIVWFERNKKARRRKRKVLSVRWMKARWRMKK